ncbi:MAG: aldehyde dehydrogenase family protein [Candidatus Xenobia bacterium]
MKQHWIGGEWVGKPNGKTIEVIDPATEEVIERLPAGTVDDANRAVEVANEASQTWRRMTAVQRGELLHEVAERIKAKTEDIARTLTLEGGKPLKENIDEVGWVHACFRYYAEIGRNSRGRVIPSIEPTQLSLVIKEPYGVAVCIAPYNYPLLLMAWKVAPALAAGNTVICKPSSITPLSTLAMAECFSVLPPGTVNIIVGSGKEVGDTLIKHPDTHVVAFTGSTEVGKHIGRLCADLAKKVTLEMGGKDPFVVCEDSDIDIAARAVAWAAFLNAGQVCTSSERIYVQQSIADQFLDKLVAFTKTLKIGPGIHPTTDVGPLARGHYRAKVEEHVEDAKKAGATVLAGGRRPSGLSKGFFYEPTVMAGVNHSMSVMNTETFGPVAPVMVYQDFDEAIKYASGTEYGLGAIIYTRDANKAKTFFEEVKAGTVWINDPLTDNDAGPFGGMKMSGVGRELGTEGLEEFQETKHVHWDFVQNEKPWWYPYSKS